MVAEVSLTQGKVALIDDEDVELVSQFSWHAQKRCRYAASSSLRRRGGHMLFMHRLIANPPDGMQVDHINGDGLDNRRENLRVCSPQQNTHNRRRGRTNKSSQYKGVSRGQTRGWRAYICANKTQVGLGTFDTEIEAAQAYDRAAAELHGEFARLNFGGKYPLFPVEQ